MIATGCGCIAPQGTIFRGQLGANIGECEVLISRDEAMGARAAATEVERCLRHGVEPFGRAGWDKLDEALSFSLPPIRVLRHVSTA